MYVCMYVMNQDRLKDLFIISLERDSSDSMKKMVKTWPIY